uniref:Uncharacterized protein n=1 Tax=Anguilla anguilla TaxID=7936 RepID=A0A0E9SJB3_ANGAN
MSDSNDKTSTLMSLKSNIPMESPFLLLQKLNILKIY